MRILPLERNGVMSKTPVIVLVRPQMAENIGAVARAMLNSCCTELRIVDPRDGWPNDAAYPMASGADEVLDNAKCYDTVEEAIADCHYVFATSARPRDMIKATVTSKDGAIKTHALQNKGQKVAVLFGAERSGLTNDEMAVANAFISVPLNPDFKSLNLAQSVLLFTYEWYQARGIETADAEIMDKATKEEVDQFLKRLIAELDKSRFFSTEEMRPTMVQNITNMFHRLDFDDQELRTLHGMLSALIEK